jgi:hypothetical protein
MESTIGQKLLNAAGIAVKEAILVAPFVKVDALRRILERIAPATSVTVVARWIPGEILAGVCDLEIYDLILARQNAELLVHPLLHAKSYRFDDSVYIGSANLTSKALGWACPSNLEILELASEQAPSIRELERHLLATSTKVDASYRDEMSRQVELLGEQLTIHECLFQAHLPARLSSWLPKCRDPRRLWLVYSDPHEARKRTVESAYRAAVDDLLAIGPPTGLLVHEFRELIAATLSNLPIVIQIAHLAARGLLEADAIKIMADFRSPSDEAYDASNRWEVLREWLIEFFPDVYRRDTYPEVFRIAKVVG